MFIKLNKRRDTPQLVYIRLCQTQGCELRDKTLKLERYLLGYRAPSATFPYSRRAGCIYSVRSI
jgi:hypothetical protein